MSSYKSYCGGREGDGERWSEREKEAGREGERERQRQKLISKRIVCYPPIKFFIK